MCQLLRVRDWRGLVNGDRSSVSQQLGALPGCAHCAVLTLLALSAKLKQKAAQVCVWGVGCITMGLNVSSNACSFVFL